MPDVSSDSSYSTASILTCVGKGSCALGEASIAFSFIGVAFLILLSPGLNKKQSPGGREVWQSCDTLFLVHREQHPGCVKVRNVLMNMYPVIWRQMRSEEGHFHREEC